MNRMFDVDCPRTPDGGDDDKNEGGKNATTTNPKPPSFSSRPPRSSSVTRQQPRTTTTPKGTMRKQVFSPRLRGSSRKSSAAVPLEPEEYIAPIQVDHSLNKPPRAPNSGGGPGVPRAPTSGPSSYRAAPNSGNGGNGTNPFDANNGNGGGGNDNRVRSNSGNWWKQEIVDEGLDKGDNMEKYYGLNPGEKQEFYGPTPTTTSGNNPSADEQGGRTKPGMPAQQQAAGSADNGTPIQNDSNPNDNNNGGHLNTNIYQQASSMNNAGYYNAATADDYSFSNVNLSSPGVSSPGIHPTNPNGLNGSNHGAASIRDVFVQKWTKLFATPANKNQAYLPPNMNSETNIAPTSNEWYPNSPKVTFTNDFHPNGIQEKKNGFWNNLSPAQKIGVGLIWVGVVCTIFGVTISELKKVSGGNASGGDNGGSSQVQGMAQLVDTPSPTPWLDTLEPTLKPTLRPSERPTTRSPTKNPVTPAPIAGYHAIHGKANDGTEHPTRSPVTARPSGLPTPGPTKVATTAPTEVPTKAPIVVQESVQSAPGANCNDEDGYYANHLSNPKDCVWLGNKSGYSDRKDKNCGGRPVEDEDNGGTIIYPMTALGGMCRNVCGLYNGCSTEEGGVEGMAPMMGSTNGDYLRPSPVKRPAPTKHQKCQDRQGFFLNHLLNSKTCEWLYNDKPGETDRKDKNCGFANYPATELGRACLKTCGLYHPNKDECEEGAVVGKLTVANGHMMRSFSSPSYSFSLTSSSTACVNGEGTYMDHKRMPKSCSWLLGSGHGDDYFAEHRQEKNCGSKSHIITELGRECPWSCMGYNDCGS
mmetsp:Transcript_32718/g.59059  ORF Transcript_32718/g.59059 Transcript_32718/m.59059 type:complete len:810 (+) Transcript_32718:121-2550(+)